MKYNSILAQFLDSFARIAVDRAFNKTTSQTYFQIYTEIFAIIISASGFEILWSQSKKEIHSHKPLNKKKLIFRITGSVMVLSHQHPGEDGPLASLPT